MGFAQYGLLQGPLNYWLSEVLMYISNKLCDDRPPRDFPFCKWNVTSWILWEIAKNSLPLEALHNGIELFGSKFFMAFGSWFASRNATSCYLTGTVGGKWGTAGLLG